MNALPDRAQGALLGLACGDAVGAAVEFYPRHRFTPLNDMRGGGVFRLQRGQWTDDTSMALCLAESLLFCRGFDAADQMTRYCRWAQEGHHSSKNKAFGIGKQTLAALLAFKQSGKPDAGSRDSRHSGNGSLMRLAPVVLFYHDHPDLADYAERSSRTTHASPECVHACRYFACVLQRALHGCNKVQLFDFEYTDTLPDDLAAVVRGSFRTKTADDIKASGYVVESLEAALWAFWHSHDFRSAVLAAANLGDDADTAAAICGQLAGAFYGMHNIPASWLNDLYRRDDIARFAVQLINRHTA
ncbi:ADP-ribosylglycohydrolase family protein [Conchiformibius kuhniae]|uniref:ADP-ribosylglycohydrolase family protein n=1 Tax=Conchiformibius kuhniae TaxID=211502 RepID=A0A8T9MW13_9NEIS|nr:ADP-ribosylglycohydrolase family protein [Conchiformibius kuhniae]UOP05025.1 ADP-ribosylglycohydrolase family protein [Conchiformibius kuhniae]